MIITRQAWNGTVKFEFLQTAGEMLMSTSKELKDKYHYFVERKDSNGMGYSYQI